MRAMESNLRGVRSASGTRMENSRSSAPTMSGRANESSTPDSNNDSSGPTGSGLPDSLSTISVILACLFIGRLGGEFRTDLQIALVLPHYILKEHGGQSLITLGSEVRVIALGQTGHDPTHHRAFGAHARAGVPVGATILAASLLLGGDDAVHAFERAPPAFDAGEAVGRAQDQDGGRGYGAPQPLEDGGEGFEIAGFAPLGVAGLVGPIGQHDQGGVAAFEVSGVHRLIPTLDQRSFRAVDAHGFVGDAFRVLGDPTEQAHGRGFQRAHLETMAAWRGGALEEAGREGAFGGGFLDRRAVVGESHAAATGLLQIVELDGGAVRIQVDGLAGALGGNADTAEAEQAI